MLLIAIIVAESVILRRSLRNAAFLAFPHGLMLYCIVGQIILDGVVRGSVKDNFIYTYSSMAFIDNSSYIQFLLFVLFLWIRALSFGIRVEGASINTRSVRIPIWVVTTAITLIYMYQLIHLTQISWDILWSHSEYLLLKSPEAMASRAWYVSPLASAVGPLGLVAVVSAGVFHIAGHRRASLLLLPAIAWFYLFELSAHSRIAGVFLFAAAFIWWIARRGFLALALFLGGYFTVASVLGGRGSSHHGLSSLGEFFDNVLVAFDENGMTGPIINLFEGIFVTSEIFSRPAEYDIWYKVLSFSPLPSFIDNFDKIRDGSMVRIHEYVPMSAVHEVYSFGTVYIITYFAVASYAARINMEQLARSPSLGPLFNNVIIAGAWYLGLTYPCRTTFRFFCISMLITALIAGRRYMYSIFRIDKAKLGPQH